ncbi:MAG: UDP-N-acetylmuramoyl-tripeptide--D-alanyl-D-alanine ligase [Clostridia bacterium]|nr:UDP-N-acetylmuramoyl-tripeptide--D-alanyl-D-alanine ligase [Clostridia bacterium]
MEYLIFKAVFALILAVCATVGVTRQFQMLQQNSYFASRYFGWLKLNRPFSFGRVFSLLLGGGVIASCILFELSFGDADHSRYVTAIILGSVFTVLSLLAAYACAAAPIKQNRRSIKPLVCTARVKRMYVTAAVLCLAFGAASLVEGAAGLVFLAVLLILCFLPWTLTFIVLGITKPIEKLIAKKYINEAKRILKNRPSLTTVGVTGSYGKTGTKFILKGLLEEGLNVTATPGSFNTPMGVVRTVREHLRPETEVFICEMGAKKKGDIKEICDIAAPQIGVITSVGPQHLDTFGSVETVADTKFELADSANEVFLNYDNEIIRARGAKYNATSYGTTPDCDVYAEDISYGSFGADFAVVCDDERIPISTRLLGKHNVLNITAGVAVAKRLGLSSKAISYAVSRLSPTEHRLELKSFINGSLMIDDAYNANPEGSVEAVNVLGSFDGRKKILVTPGLVELGDKEYEYNYNLGLAAAEKCDIIILVGQNRSIPLRDAINTTDFNKDNVFVVSSFAEAMERLRVLTDKNTVTLIENDLPDNYLN